MQEIVTIRDASLEIAPSFQASVHECPVNIYRMKVDAQSFDSRRFSFSFRSPGNRLICSPQAFIEFELDCHIPYNIPSELLGRWGKLGIWKISIYLFTYFSFTR